MGVFYPGPTGKYDRWGIFPCILGTFLLCLVTILVALPVGVASAIYLNEYAGRGKVVRLIRLGINNLAGVPSICFRAVRPGFFCIVLKMGVSIAAGG